MLLTKPLASDCQTVMVIILPEKKVNSVEMLLDKFAVSDWRMSDRIFLISIEDQYIKSVERTVSSLRRQCRAYGLNEKSKNVRYLVNDELNINPIGAAKSILPADFVSIVRHKKLLDYMLEARLKEWGLYWLQAALLEVKKWQFDEMTENNLDQWLMQFDQVSGGSKRWVGEYLLRNFRVWSSEKFANEIQDGKISTPLAGQACIIRYENGKSADSISTILRKQLPHLLGNSDVKEYRAFIEKNNNLDRYIFEDGVFTGVEICDIFNDLMGVGSAKKYEPLTNSTSMNCKKTFIKAAIGTDVGLHRIRTQIKQLGIDVEISAKNEIAVLSHSGKSKLETGTLYKKDGDGKLVFSSVDEDVIPQAFLDNRWSHRRTEAVDFCKKIGLALFSSYQKSKGKDWTAERLNECALGAGNMAFLLSFSHSLPKSTLPVFWCHGTVLDHKGKGFQWIPLFPSAHKR